MKVGSSSSFFDLRVVRSRSAKADAAIANGAETEASQTPLAEHLKDWQEARTNGVSASNSKTKQAALDKAAILKRRLEMLKAMLLFASPEEAKSIARQLKGIASELASLGKNVGGNSSAGATLAVPGTTSAASETASAETGADEAVAPTAAGPTSTSSDAQQSDAASDDDVAGKKTGSDSAKSSESTQKSDDGALRKAIDEAKHLLKQVILSVKAKLKEGEEEARRDLQTAENSLAELDRALAQETSANLYTAVGELTAELGGADLSLSSALAGVGVDVSI